MVDPPNEWKEIIKTKFKELVKKTSQNDLLRNCSLRDLAERIHEHYVVTPADKNAQKPVFWCRKFYVAQALAFMRDANVFAPEPRPSADVVSDMQKFSEKYGCLQNPNTT